MTVRKIRTLKLQEEIHSDDKWNTFIEKNGLIVVDVYASWCGPCSAMRTTLRRVRHELGGNNLHFATAASDNITYLKEFRNKSVPTWVFVVEGKIVNILYGANSPKLMRMISEELKKATVVKDPQEMMEMNFQVF